MRGRRGLSEVLGAFMLVVIFVGVAATVYTLQERAAREAVEALDTASKRAALLASPPLVELVDRGDGVYMVLSTTIETVIDKVVLIGPGGEVRVVDLGRRVAPGETIEVRLMDACKPVRLILVTSDGATIHYPREPGRRFCDPQNGDTPPMVHPETGRTLISMAPREPIYEPVATFNGTIQVKGRFGGVPADPGNRKSWLTVYYENGTRAGTIQGPSRGVTIERAGPIALQVEEIPVTGNATVLALRAYDENGAMLVISGTVWVSIWAEAYRVREAPPLCNSIYPDRVVMPIVIGTSLLPGAQFNLTCKTTSYSAWPSFRLVVRGNSTGIVQSAERVVVAIGTTPFEPRTTVTVSYNLTFYRVTGTESYTVTVNPPALLSLGAIGLAGKWSLENETLAAMRVVDPTRVRVSAIDSGSVLGSWTLAPSESVTVRSATHPALTLRIDYYKLLPPTMLQAYEITVESESGDNYEVLHYTGALEARPVPSPWALPLELDIAHREASLTILLEPWNTTLKPAPGKGYLDGLFPAETLTAQGNTTVLPAAWKSGEGAYRAEPRELVRARAGEEITVEEVRDALGWGTYVVIAVSVGQVQGPLFPVDLVVAGVYWLN